MITSADIIPVTGVAPFSTLASLLEDEVILRSATDHIVVSDASRSLMSSGQDLVSI